MATTTAKGTKGAVGKAPLTADDPRALLRFMLLVRATEERALAFYRHAWRERTPAPPPPGGRPRRSRATEWEPCVSLRNG
jgi:hypothetical protein